MDIVELRSSLEQIPILDTHEHLLPASALTTSANILGQVIRNAYLGIDCIAAGSPREIWEPGSLVHSCILPAANDTFPAVDWKEVVPLFSDIKYTSYFRAFMEGLQVLYDLWPGVEIEKWQELEGKVNKAYLEQDHIEKGLAQAGIKFVLRDPFYSVIDPQDWSSRVSSVFRVDDFLGSPWHSEPGYYLPAAEIADAWGLEINTLDDLIKAVEVGFSRYHDNGSKAVKTAIAYRRILKFNPVSKAEAEGAFEDLKREFHPQSNLILGNYMIRRVIELCEAWDKPLQVHTGMNYGMLDEAAPVNLVNLFIEFPEVRFVLFHGGYPNSDSAGLLAKSFSNVYLDLVWMPQLSQSMAVDMISRWIDLVPINKIMWGGDVWTIEECLGAVQFIKSSLAQALFRKVTNQNYTSADCLDIAHRVMWKNGVELYKLEDIWQERS